MHYTPLAGMGFPSCRRRITATVFLGLSLFTHHSKRDFGFLEEWLGSGLLILLAMIIVGMMFSIPYLQLCIASLGCVIFSGYIIYDTHQIVHTLGPDDAIMGAIQLYMDVLNLFLFVLNCMSNQND